MAWKPRGALRGGLLGCVVGALLGGLVFLSGDAAGAKNFLVYGSIFGVLLASSGLGRDLAGTSLATSLPTALLAAVLIGAGEIAIIAPRGLTGSIEYLEAITATAAFIFVIILA